VPILPPKPAPTEPGTPRAPRCSRRARVAVLTAVAVLAGGLAEGLVVSAGAATRVVRLTSSTGAAPTGAANGAKVTVSGTGVVTGTPDELTIQMGASTTASSATGALDENNTEVAALEGVFRSAGVKRADLQTSGLSLQANYDSSGAVSGYQASDVLTITLHNLRKAGDVIDAGAHAVGNDVQIDGITFSIANTSSLLASARTRAVQAAQAKAEAFASAAGTSLGPVLSITDEEQQTPPITEPTKFAASSSAGTSTPVPIQAGSQQLSIQVSVVYSLKSGRS
jgi:uncharacterized protein YggE